MGACHRERRRAWRRVCYLLTKERELTRTSFTINPNLSNLRDGFFRPIQSQILLADALTWNVSLF